MLILKQPLVTMPTEPPFVVCAPKAWSNYIKTSAEGMQLTCRKTQPVDENGRCRTELRIHRDGTTRRLFELDPPGSPRATAIDMLIPLDWKKDDQKCLVFQWHAEVKPGDPPQSTGNPPLSAFIWNDNFYIRAWPSRNGYKDLYKKPVVKGKWQRFEFEIKWPKGAGEGSVAAFCDDKELFPKYTGPLGYPEAQYIYSSIGLYWPGFAASKVDSHIAQYRRWWVGETRSDLK